MDRASLSDRTRALVCSTLGVSLERPEPGYRDSAGVGIDGDWVGGFAQPGVILNAATAVRLTIDGAGGSTIDEYGRATLQIIRHPDRVEIIKRYDGKGKAGTFRYVGHLADGTLTGFWHSLARPTFCGVFWLTRVDRLSSTALATMDKRVQTRSPRKLAVQAFNVAMIALVVGGGVVSIWLRIAGFVMWGAFIATYRRRAQALRGEVQGWQRLLA